MSSTLNEIKNRLASSMSSSLVSKPLDRSLWPSRKIGSTAPDINSMEKPAISLSQMLPLGFFSWKVMLVIIVLIMLFWIVRPYLNQFSAVVDLLKSFSGSSVKTLETTTKAEDVAIEESATKVDQDMKKILPKKTLQEPKPDDAASSLQGGAKTGFCLAGEWKGVRSCVKVENGKNCASGQLFPTEELCVNPAKR